jgi:hypothetical protein
MGKGLFFGWVWVGVEDFMCVLEGDSVVVDCTWDVGFLGFEGDPNWCRGVF